MKVEIYSDIVCPWCYIGERRFGYALADFPGADEVEVVFRPYQLDPNAPAEAVPVSEYLRKRFGMRMQDARNRVDAAAEGEGISFDWDRALTANTRNAHRLMKYAEREHGSNLQCALAERLFELHFSRGGDVGDIEQLADAAAGVGMDRDRALRYLRSDEGSSELDAELETARAQGIRAVPTFIFDGKWVVEGAQQRETMLRALAEVARMTGATAAAAPSGDACEDDACAV